MNVQIIQYHGGDRCRIFALGLDDRFPFLDFVEECDKTHPKELVRLIALLDRFADTGKIHDRTKVNSLGDGLYEFKTSGGLRVTWFWDAGYAVICGHCFIKKSQNTPAKELETARKWQGWYLKEKQEGGIKEIKR